MLVREKIGMSVGLLSCVAFVAATFLLWTAARADYNQRRTALAHEELGSYLMLNGTIYRTFERVRRDLLEGPGVLQFSFADVEREVIGYLDEIDESARTAAKLTRDQTYQAKLQAVEDIRQELEQAFSEVRDVIQFVALGNRIKARKLLDQTLATRVDDRIASMIEKSIALARGQVSTSLAEVEFVNRLSFWVAFCMVVVAVTSSFFVFLTLVTRVNIGLKTLADGADQFAEGKLDDNIKLGGSDEFALLGERFNAMARRIRAKQSDLERAQEDLKQAHNSLQRRDMLRREFFAEIGHELRTPVTAIRGEAEVALRVKEDKTQAHQSALRRIVTITEQLTNNVGDIFLIAREQAGVLDFRIEAVDLTSAVRSAVDQMASIFTAADIKADIRMPEEPAIIEGDQRRLIQLITILLSNAVSHVGDGAEVRLEVKYERDAVCVLVSDDGAGIPENERHTVFDRYSRGTDAGRGGTGLGLPIARSLTQAHGGQISLCESELGGACFKLRFPKINETLEI